MERRMSIEELARLEHAANSPSTKAFALAEATRLRKQRKQVAWKEARRRG